MDQPEEASEPKTLRTRLWDLITYLMWLPLLTAKSMAVRVIGWLTSIYLFFEPVIKKVWGLICHISPKVAVYAEKLPCIGEKLA